MVVSINCPLSVWRMQCFQVTHTTTLTPEEYALHAEPDAGHGVGQILSLNSICQEYKNSIKTLQLHNLYRLQFYKWNLTSLFTATWLLKTRTHNSGILADQN
ncbi:hypothetical protein AVEN_225235-1 [Araneus ventricosus]|uniref:Uncharacterized protein n=1 Tax=Araneus ventricosus TaxID=182803 RepID=A0A4Y2ALM2_ARAVE|nr:hypothetical protein AVEN_225235-1 [Araneus ventricosus]